MPDDTPEVERLRSWCAMLEEANKAWQAENAKLREQGERLFDKALELKALELGTENAKLRLLVRNLIRATHPADRAELIANAAELGIEVDE